MFYLVDFTHRKDFATSHAPLIPLKANNLREAKEEVKAMAPTLANVTKASVLKLRILQLSDELIIDIAEALAQGEEEKERKELQRLKAKFGE